MAHQGKDILSSDLDIFGEGTDEDTNDTGNDYDIFGGGADEEETPAEEAAETPTEEAAEETSGEEAKETHTDGSADEKTEGLDEELDIDIENLFADIEAEAKGNPELEKLVDSLRDEISSKTTENNILQKENATLNEKLMSRVGDDSNLWIYKWVISNLESNPKLMMLVKHIGNTSSDAIKGKLVGVVTDLLYDLTGEDVSDLINKDQSSKILAATWKSSNSSMPDMKSNEDEKDMDYEESISSLF